MPYTYKFHPITSPNNMFVSGGSYTYSKDIWVRMERGKASSEHAVWSDSLNAKLTVATYHKDGKTTFRGIHFSLPLSGQRYDTMVEFDIFTISTEVILQKQYGKTLRLYKEDGKDNGHRSYEYAENNPKQFDNTKHHGVLHAVAYLKGLDYASKFGAKISHQKDTLLKMADVTNIDLIYSTDFNAEEISKKVISDSIVKPRRSSGYSLNVFDVVVPELVGGVLHVSPHFDTYLLGSLIYLNVHLHTVNVSEVMPAIKQSLQWPQFGELDDEEIDQESIDFSNDIAIMLGHKGGRFDGSVKISRML